MIQMQRYININIVIGVDMNKDINFNNEENILKYVFFC